MDAIAAAIDNLKDNFNNVIKDYDVYEVGPKYVTTASLWQTTVKASYLISFGRLS